MKHTAPKLLPCPFCGEDTAAWGRGKQKLKYGNEQVYCDTCLAITAPEGTKEEAAENWNVRAGLHEEREKLLGELVEALDYYGSHSVMCSWWGTPPLKNCDCGYTNLLTRARQVQESDREKSRVNRMGFGLGANIIMDKTDVPRAKEVPPVVKVSEMAKPYTLEQIAEDLANEIYYHQTNNRSRLKQFLIQFAEEIKRQGIEP